MDLLAPFARTVIAPVWAKWERSPYLRHARRLRRTQYDPLESIEQRQWAALLAILRHADQSSPFWRERFRDAGVDANALGSMDEFRKIPLLTKADLREQGRRLRSEVYEHTSVHQKRTSGSTGVSVDVVVDDAAQQFKRACTLRSDEWSGWRLGQRVAAVWGNPEYLKRGWRGRVRNLLLDRIVFLDTLKMDETTMARFARALERRPPSLLFGHAHSLYLFAEFVRGIPTLAIQPKAIISTAMVLHTWERKLIEKTFACPVTNRYGCEELSLIACECERHEGLHVNSDGIYLEILRPDGTPCEPREPGIVVVTDLVNRAMPMIRYQVGDTAAWSGNPCSCGRTLPLLARIEGRIADYVVTQRGELISGISLTENFAVLVPGIAQLQIVQEAVDRFVFRIVQGPDFGEASQEKIRELVELRFGQGTGYSCEFVDRIPQEPSGKYRFCISKVSSPFTAAPKISGSAP